MLEWIVKLARVGERAYLQRVRLRASKSSRLILRVGFVAADPRVGRRADFEDRPAGAPAATPRPNRTSSGDQALAKAGSSLCPSLRKHQ